MNQMPAFVIIFLKRGLIGLTWQIFKIFIAFASICRMTLVIGVKIDTNDWPGFDKRKQWNVVNIIMLQRNKECLRKALIQQHFIFL
jgi:hypothetical protein